MSVASRITQNLEHSLVSLDIRIRQLHNEAVGFKDGSTPSNDFLWRIETCETALGELLEQARLKSDDNSVEYIALLERQLKVVRNRYNKHLRSVADKAE